MIQQVSAVTNKRIKEIELLRNLPRRVLEFVMTETHVEHHNAGSRIVAQGETSDQVLYLLDGHINVTTPEGKQVSYEAGSRLNRLPLNEANPHHADVSCSTAVAVLCIPRELHSAIRSLPSATQNRSNRTVKPDHPDGPEDELFWEFQEAIKTNTLELPSMPDITIRIAKVIQDSNTDSEDIARVLQADPTVAAKIINVVNSAAYRGKTQIDNLPDAVTRLGRSVTHNLVISFALSKLFHSRSQDLKQRMLKLWKHVSYVAPICHELANVTPGLAPDQALLCGLLHDIGALAILGNARSKPELANNPDLLDRMVKNLKAEVGAMVLKKWEFPGYFVQAALHAEDWMEDIGEDPDYVDLVVVAQLHAFIGTPMMGRLPRLDLVPAFHKLALGKLTPRHSIQILDNAKDQIREMRELLKIS
ncbi:MAG: HDOD domain-containing protein [Candidatus Thiodiazotropha sp.]